MYPSRLNLPTPLDYSHRPPLTPPLQSGSPRSKDKETGTAACLSQHQSPLMRLPTELRLLIWEYVLGGDELKITVKTPKARRLLGSPIFVRVCHDPICEWVGVHLVQGKTPWTPACFHEFRRFPPPVTETVYGLLQSCRLVYAEAILTLYASNSFMFPGPSHLCVFKKAVLPQRWSKVRRIRINMSFQEAAHAEDGGAPSTNWNEMASALRQVDSLLEFTIYMGSFPNELVPAVRQVSDTTGRQLAAMLDNFSLLADLKVVWSPWHVYVTCGEWTQFVSEFPWKQTLSPPPEDVCSTLRKKLRDRGVNCVVDGYESVQKFGLWEE